MAVYRTTFQPRPRAEALVIHCSDPRYQAHFQEFLHRHLGLDTYELIAIPGGPQVLTLADYLPKFAWAGWHWVKFLMDVAKPQRVILIAHESCRWYRDGRFWQHTGDLRKRQVGDLATVAAGIRERYDSLPIECYFASHDGAHVAFDAVSPSAASRR
ncbi:MAG: hypothetical protein ACKV22_07880 [Bryobacteraceae bacterium]